MGIHKAAIIFGKLSGMKKRGQTSLLSIGITEHQKKEALQIISKLGGTKGGVARAKKLSPQARKEIASKAAQARWKKILESGLTI